jgi:glycosyltransferase involved in cell wall biosynthesis
VSIVAVVTSSPPLVEGGHLVIARALVAALRAAGHESELVITPQNRFGRNTSTYLSNWLADVGRTGDGRPIDQVISLRWPSYAVRHPVHVSWLNHTMREYYDLWPRFRKQLHGPSLLKEHLRRQVIRRVDRWMLAHNVTAVFAQSATVQRRLREFIGVQADVLYPPAPPRPYRCEAYEPFILVISRLTALKRVDLVVEALAQPAAAGVRCVVAGDGDTAADIRQLARELGVADRVRFLGYVDEATLLDTLARCRAVAFVPLDEDYGFVTVEAFASGKPVITTRDSGGPVELVRDGVNGIVVDPSAPALAAAMQQLADDGARAERLGAAGRRLTDEMSWAAAVQRLLL